LVELGESRIPLLAPHIDHAEIGMRRGGLGIDSQNVAKRGFGGVQIIDGEGLLAAVENRGRVYLRSGMVLGATVGSNGD